MESTISGLDIIGKGYDIFGRYAHPSSVINNRIFKQIENSETVYKTVSIWDNIYQVPDLLELVEEHTSEASYIEGSSMSNFQQELDIKVNMEGRYMYFSGEAEFGFHQSKQVSNAYYYALLSSIVKGYRLTFPDNETLINKIGLDSNFEDELKNGGNQDEEIDKFFKKYGTHFLGEAILGGKNSYHATVEKSSISESLSVESSVKASYNTIVTSASMSVDASYTSEQSINSTHSETGIETVGGDETMAPLMLTNSDTYEQWLQTISVDPVLVDLTSNSLRPIWDLLTNLIEDTEDSKELLETRREALKDRFEKLSAESRGSIARGTASHGAAIYPPWGTKSDWNIFLTPAVMGRSEESSSNDVDNAILEYDYDVDKDYDYPDHWQIKARYRFRKNKGDVSGIRWYEDGKVNYILLPKEIYDTSTGKSKLISKVEVIDNRVTDDEDGNQILNLNAPDNTGNWVYLAVPFYLNYSEDTESNDTDNALIGWNWNFNQSDYLITSDNDAFLLYRKGAKDEDMKKVYKDFKILWVHSDYAYWTGAYGGQVLQLPPDDDKKVSDWELITSPTKIGDISAGDNRNQRSLIKLESLISKVNDQWTVDVNFILVGNEDDSSTVSTNYGQVECLFIRSSILNGNTFPDS